MNVKHGMYSAEAIQEKKQMRILMKIARHGLE